MIFPKQFFTIPMQKILEKHHGSLTRENALAIYDGNITLNFIMYTDENEEDWMEYSAAFPLKEILIEGIWETQLINNEIHYFKDVDENTSKYFVPQKGDELYQIHIELCQLIASELALWGPIYSYAISDAVSIRIYSSYMNITQDDKTFQKSYGTIYNYEYPHWDGFQQFFNKIGKRVGHDFSKKKIEEMCHILLNKEDITLYLSTTDNITYYFNEKWPPEQLEMSSEMGCSL